MKKSILLTLLTIFIQQVLLSQTWIKKYDIGKYAIANSIIEQYDKGYVFGGSIDHSKYAKIYKTDLNGNLQWSKSFGDGKYQMVVRNIDKTMDGGCVFCLDAEVISNIFSSRNA